jgi:hypothetical protein
MPRRQAPIATAPPCALLDGGSPCTPRVHQREASAAEQRRASERQTDHRPRLAPSSAQGTALRAMVCVSARR